MLEFIWRKNKGKLKLSNLHRNSWRFELHPLSKGLDLGSQFAFQKESTLMRLKQCKSSAASFLIILACSWEVIVRIITMTPLKIVIADP